MEYNYNYITTILPFPTLILLFLKDHYEIQVYTFFSLVT